MSSYPDLASLEVSLYASSDDDSLIRVLERGTDFDYVVESNSIRFSIETLPPSETYVVAEYRIVPVAPIVEASDESTSAAENGGE